MRSNDSSLGPGRGLCGERGGPGGRWAQVWGRGRSGRGCLRLLCVRRQPLGPGKRGCFLRSVVGGEGLPSLVPD